MDPAALPPRPPWLLRLWRWTGWFFICCAFIGALLPAVPTTPFLLLALYAFARSDRRMVRRILRHRIYGGYLRDYLKGRGIPLSAKLTMFVVLSASISLSLYALTRSNLAWPLVQAAAFLMICVFVGVNAIVLREPNRKKKRP